MRVVVGGYAANINKTFTTGLCPWGNMQTALRAWKCTPSAACGGISPGGGDSSGAML
jgi:hypothetical protein